MKIILDTQSVHFPLSGIGRYTLELAKGLRGSAKVDEVKFLRGDCFVEHLGDALQKVPNDKFNLSLGGLKALLKRFKPLLRCSSFLFIYRRWCNRQVDKLLEPHQDYIFHGPNFTVPRFGGKSVVTVHDLSVFTHAECHPPERVSFLQKETLRSIQHADLVLTDTEAVKNQLLEYFKFSPRRVSVVPLAADPVFHPRPEAKTQFTLSKYGLRHCRYLLTVATIEPRKNYQSLLQAYQKLSAEIKQRYPMVIVGARGWCSDEVFSCLSTMVEAGEVIYLDYVAEDDLPILYAGAICFTFMSLYEGFGLPVLESMQSGVPVICSRDAALLEVGSGAVKAIDACNVEAITGALKEMLECTSLRQSYIDLGLMQAQKFSWVKTVSCLLDCYSSLCESSKNK